MMLNKCFVLDVYLHTNIYWSRYKNYNINDSQVNAVNLEMHVNHNIIIGISKIERHRKNMLSNYYFLPNQFHIVSGQSIL